MKSCCTCANLLPFCIPSTEKKKGNLPQDRVVLCCGRIICGACTKDNPRFASYCPYCQISSDPSPLPQRLRDPPSYTAVPSSTTSHVMGEMPSAPPPYSPSTNDGNKPRRRTVDPEKGGLEDDEENEKKGAPEDTLHFLDHDRDSITSLSFRYGVPAAALRRANNITSDHLLSGRKAISIPGRYYKGGISLSPRPILGEEEELRRAKIRRFMTSCKVSDYDVAVLYLEQSGYSLDESVEAYLEDEAWERDHVRGSVPRKGSTAQNRGPFWRGLSRRV